MSEFNFKAFLLTNQWVEAKEGLWQKGLKTIKLIGGNKMIVNNLDKTVKHKHIATCLQPTGDLEAETVFWSLMLDNIEN